MLWPEVSIATYAHTSVWQKTKQLFGNILDDVAGLVESVKFQDVAITLRSGLNAGNWQDKGDQLFDALANAEMPVRVTDLKQFAYCPFAISGFRCYRRNLAFQENWISGNEGRGCSRSWTAAEKGIQFGIDDFIKSGQWNQRLNICPTIVIFTVNPVAISLISRFRFVGNHATPNRLSCGECIFLKNNAFRCGGMHSPKK
jgi:hypothetical protein